MANNSEAVLFEDLYLGERAPQEFPQTERGPVLKFLFDARDVFLGALNGAHEHPVGSIEIGAACAATGLALAYSHHRAA